MGSTVPLPDGQEVTLPGPKPDEEIPYGSKGHPVSNPYLRKLSDRHQAFLRLYVSNGFNATQAALECGYAEGSASEVARQIRKRADFKAALEWELKAIGDLPSNSGQVDPNLVLTTLGKIAIEGKGPDGVSFRGSDVIKALELLMKHFGLLVDRLEVTDPSKMLAELLALSPDEIPNAEMKMIRDRIKGAADGSED